MLHRPRRTLVDDCVKAHRADDRRRLVRDGLFGKAAEPGGLIEYVRRLPALTRHAGVATCGRVARLLRMKECDTVRGSRTKSADSTTLAASGWATHRRSQGAPCAPVLKRAAGECCPMPRRRSLFTSQLLLADRLAPTPGATTQQRQRQPDEHGPGRLGHAAGRRGRRNAEVGLPGGQRRRVVDSADAALPYQEVVAVRVAVSVEVAGFRSAR